MTCEIGDCRETMRRWIAEGVRAQMCVTSPPYWGLRDYGTATWDGGSAECDHKAGSFYGEKSDTNRGAIRGGPFKESCGRCGASRVDQQLGLEPTPEEFVANMVEVFRLVRELLADDGTLWLNLGDSYATGAGSVGECPGGGKQGESWKLRGKMTPPNRMPIAGLKPKDLCGIPWHVAFALQADGWYLRSDIIWSKPNPMPESVTDRPTKAHEYLFLLSKRERYYYDADAVREPAEYGRREQPANTWDRCGLNAKRVPGTSKGSDPSAGRNRRTVWEIATQPYNGAHFATFPEALVEPCILAGSRVGDVVLDPFFGSGTVGQVAQNLGRKWLGCELNSDYAALQHTRTAQQGLELA